MTLAALAERQGAVARQRAADAVRRLYAALAVAVRPDPVVTVSAWADANRHLSGVSASEPGPWRTDRVPYLREIMDSLGADDPCEVVVVVKGAQVGGSECLNNAIGYYMDASPGPVLLVEPSLDVVKRYSKQRIAPMIAASPTLQSKVSDPRERDSGNTMFAKEFPGGILIMTGANSAAGLRSMPMRRALLDEVDAYPRDLDDEGDPVQLAEQRTATFAGRKLALVSTPLVRATSRIWPAYMQGDQRRYHVPCPHCGVELVLDFFGGMRWAKEVDPEDPRKTIHRPDLGVWYECEHCAGHIEDRHKAWMLPRGVWRGTAKGDGRTRSYHLSSLYSPVGWLGWRDIVRLWLEAQGDAHKLQVFFNTILGLTWDSLDAGKIDPDELAARCEDYLPPADSGEAVTVPPEVAVITVGVDVQDDRLELEVVGWGARQESWSLAYEVVDGDPSAPIDHPDSVWAALDAVLSRAWRHPSGVDLTVAAACVDSGGHHTQAVYTYAKARRSRRVWAIKGHGGEGRPIWKLTRTAKAKLDVYMVGVDAAKEQLYHRLRLTEHGPGYCHFPTDRTPAYFTGLTCETQVRKYRKGHVKIEWQKPDKARNEPLDCRVYATAALCGWLAKGRRIEAALDRLRGGGQTTRRAAPVDRPPDPDGDGGTPARKGWLSGGGPRAPRGDGTGRKRGGWLSGGR